MERFLPSVDEYIGHILLKLKKKKKDGRKTPILLLLGDAAVQYDMLGNTDIKFLRQIDHRVLLAEAERTRLSGTEHGDFYSDFAEIPYFLFSYCGF